MACPVEAPRTALVDQNGVCQCANSEAALLRPTLALRHWTVIGLATRGIMMIESCRAIVPTENQIPVGWKG
jgi:hypothetical protein